MKQQASSAAWLFEIGRYRPLTPALLAGAGLVPEPIAAVRVSLIRVVPGGAWHLASALGCVSIGRRTT